MYITGINFEESTYNVQSVNSTGLSSETVVSGNTSTESIFDGYFDKSNSYDRRIDAFQQNEVGDCWLLSDAKSLQNTDFGAKAIKDAIDYQHNGAETDPYTVTIYNTFGEKQTIEITKADMEKYMNTNKNYSTGDGDTRLLEAAVAKYFVQEIEAGRMKGRSVNDPLEGSPFGVYSTDYMFTGKMPHGLTTVDVNPENAQYFDKLTNENMNGVMNKYADNPSNMSMTVAFKDRTFLQKLLGTVSREQQDTNHSYSITGVNRNSSGEIVSVTYSNPHNSSIEYTVSYGKFKNIIAQISYLSAED